MSNNENVLKFVNDVKDEYILLLYSDKINRYPYCCHLSANIVAFCLNVHFDSNFKHCKYGPSSSHGVTSNGEIVIDFTVFQFKEKKRSENMSSNGYIIEVESLLLDESEMYPIISRYSEPSNHLDFLERVYKVKNCEIELYTPESLKNVVDPEKRESFIKYVKLEIEQYRKHCELLYT